MSLEALRGGRRTVTLVLSPSLSYAAPGRRGPIVLPLPLDGGVDLGAVGRALGLDPASVRLNGHFLSRGPDLVSTLTWDSLLSFFSARGLPAGASAADPIIVSGKPLPFSSELHSPCKRKVGLDNESPLKKHRVFRDTSAIRELDNGQVDDDESISFKRRLRLEDSYTSKRPKLTECNPGSSANESLKLPTIVPKTGISHSCINGLGKRLREDEAGVSFSCKRIK